MPDSCLFFFSSSRTAVTIGIIIAAAAVFAIHIDKNHEIKINPNISLLGEDPIVLRVPSAILLKFKVQRKNRIVS